MPTVSAGTSRLPRKADALKRLLGAAFFAEDEAREVREVRKTCLVAFAAARTTVRVIALIVRWYARLKKGLPMRFDILAFGELGWGAGYVYNCRRPGLIGMFDTERTDHPGQCTSDENASKNTACAASSRTVAITRSPAVRR